MCPASGMSRSWWTSCARWAPRWKETDPTTLRITCRDIRASEPDPALVGKLRGSVLLLGALLGRVGRAELAPPGGDFPARRTITTHLQALVALGGRMVDDPSGHRLEAPDGLHGASMYLVEASVTGTETALLAAAQAQGHHRDSPRGVRTPCRRVVRVPQRDGRARARRRHVHDHARASGSPARRDAPAARRLHRGRFVGRGGRRHRRRGRGDRRRRAGPRTRRGGALPDGRQHGVGREQPRRAALDAWWRRDASRRACGRASRATS